MARRPLSTSGILAAGLLALASLADLSGTIHIPARLRRKHYGNCNVCGKLTKDETCFTCQKKSEAMDAG